MKRRLPSLNGLRAFEAAARHMSFTRAADELSVTQTAVSHQIKRLEDQLGVQLFVRRNRQLLLTEAAQEFLPAVRGAFDRLHAATEHLLRRDEAGTLTVSTMITFTSKWLVPRLAGFQARHPEIDLRLSATAALVDFAREDVDCAIRYGRGGWPGLRADFLLAEDIFPVCSPRLLEGPDALRAPADLARHTLLHVTAFREDWRVWLTAAGVPPGLVDPEHGPGFDMALHALGAAIDGQGVALGRTTLVADDIAAGRLVAPFDIRLHSDAAYYFVAPEYTADQPKIAAFRDWLLEAVGEREALAAE